MVLYLEDTASGQVEELKFRNERDGGPNGRAERDRGVQFLEGLGCQ
jgi:hypothetical protein